MKKLVISGTQAYILLLRNGNSSGVITWSTCLFFYIPNLPHVVIDEIDLYLIAIAHDSNCLFSQYKAEEMSMPLSARWNHG